MKSLIELTNSIEKIKQEIFWKSRQFKKKYEDYYEKQDKYAIYLLSDYKMLGYIEINTFLYDRKLYFAELRKNLFTVIDRIFEKKKKLGKEELKQDFVDNIYYTFYKIIKSIIVIDGLFKNAPKLDEDIYVYRGVSFLDPYYEKQMTEKLKSLRKGQSFSFENYLSTTLMNSVAMDDFILSGFAKNNEPKCCLFKIFLPKGSRILYLDSKQTGFGNNKNNKVQLLSEYEVLLPRSSLLKFIKSYTISGKIPRSCTLEELQSGKINDILVYEFKYIGIDPNREKFSDDINNDYFKNFIKDFNYISFDVSKYDLTPYQDKKNIKKIIDNFDVDRKKRIKSFHH